VGTGISFVTFAIGGLFIGYIIFPVVIYFTKKKQRRAQYIIYLSFRFFRRLMQHFGLINFSFEGIEKLQSDKGCLFISNHPTLIDYVIIVSKLKSCDVIIKESIWYNIYVKGVVRTAKYIPNIQADKMLEMIKFTKKNKHNLLLFPEGTRTTPNQPLKLQRGAANIAIRMNMPIRLIHIKTTQSSLTKQSKWYKVPKHKVEYLVSVGEKVEPNDFLHKAGNPSLAARHLTKYLTKQLEKEL